MKKRYIKSTTGSCKECGKTFDRTSGHRMYCSDDCKDKRKLRSLPSANCNGCGKKFQRLGMRKGVPVYCSKECMYENRDMSGIKFTLNDADCKQCGRVFKKTKRGQLYCSDICRERGAELNARINREDDNIEDYDAEIAETVRKLKALRDSQQVLHKPIQ